MNGKSSPTCIVADDSVLLALVVSSLLPSSKVISMFPGLRDKGFNYLQAVADANNLSMDRITVIGKKASSLTMNDLKHEKVPMFLISLNSKIYIIVFMNNECETFDPLSL
jgi:protein arginine N-methyltransferase 7